MSNPYAFLGDELIGKNGAVIKSETLKDVDAVALYFSAHWCPPCRGFTPVLAEFYNEVNENEKQLEIVFVSADQSQSQFDEYFGEMPWISVKFNKAKVQEISQKIPFSGIPYLVVLDKNGNVKNKNGRADVSNKGPAAINDWKN